MFCKNLKTLKTNNCRVKRFNVWGGCELSLTADIRIAEEHAQIGLPEVKLGLFPGGGGTQRLPRVIGASKAKEWMFAGSPVSAEEALHAGFANHVTPKGKGLEKAKELAKKFNRHSSVTFELRQR